MLVTLRNVDKTYTLGAEPFFALRNADLNIDSGELIFVVGKSGSGKSTLLNMIAGLDRPTSGEVHVAGTPVHSLSEDSLARFRGENIGVVFQFFQLLPTLTALENVMLAMDFVGKIPASRRLNRAMELLKRVDVAEQANKLPAMLSGGQQQRVAIARALANDPLLLVADEPTGNLDTQTAKDVMALFSEFASTGKTVLLVTHNRDLGVQPTRVVTILDGCVE